MAEGREAVTARQGLSDEEIERLELRPRVRLPEGTLGVQWTEEEALALLADLRSLRERVEKAEVVCEASRSCLAAYGMLPAASRPTSWQSWLEAMISWHMLINPTKEGDTDDK